ncbi:MAG: hypothetical protein A2Y12_15060 [Planctomycetes bacterium GWF2_42_9]|nr:MAG: hypothetical protein A2Y12_15060 [Planctomycetes bacterium GWF2_42_9]
MTENLKQAAQDNCKRTTTEISQTHKHWHMDLLAEQALLVSRLVEITGLLTFDNPPMVKTTSIRKQSFPKDFDRKAYCIGLIWRNPTISARELTRKAGIARSTLDMPGWSDVVSVLKASQKASSKDCKDYKSYTEDVDDDQEDDL